jgi:hypothetical protein
MADQNIPERERLRIKWVIEFRMSRVQVEMAWTNTALARLASSGG